MAEFRVLEGLQALHSELVAARQHRFDNPQVLDHLVEVHSDNFKALLDKTPRNSAHRTELNSKKVIKTKDGEYRVNDDFIYETLKVADELDLDEYEAGRIVLDCQDEDDSETQSRPLWECGLIRFYQERKYLLDCMRLCIEIANDEEIEDNLKDAFGVVVEENIFVKGSAKKIVARCMEAMQSIKATLQSINDKVVSRYMLEQASLMRPLEAADTIEFCRMSLVEQHECLAMILHAAVERRHADVNDFKQFLGALKKIDKYDQFLVHLFPVLAAYINVFGSPDGMCDFQQSRQLDDEICKTGDGDSWAISYLGAATRVWWIAEYTGYFQVDNEFDLGGLDLDAEFEKRTKAFTEALKDGAFDFILSVAADCKTEEWQDPSRMGMRQWLQRKSPPLQGDFYYFSHFLQLSLMAHLEVFIDSVITNLPELVRTLKTEEDEQRQLSQTHEQDLDLERFVVIISYAYEDRPDAAMTFFEDPDSALYGFLQWASTKASTPLVSAFCEMLQSLACNEETATAAHTFLLDEGHQSSGKMRRSQSLTWNQIFRELEFFAKKLSERPNPSQMQIQRPGKSSTDQGEAEPESAMMLECYVRLIGKLTAESRTCRIRLASTQELMFPYILFKLANANVTPRLRAAVFYSLKSLLVAKTVVESDVLWNLVDNFTMGALDPTSPSTAQQQRSPTSQLTYEELQKSAFNDLAIGFEEPNAFIQLLTSLVTPYPVSDGLNDTLPFPEFLGINKRMPGIEIYVDFVFLVFTFKPKEITDQGQLRMLRLSCLEFILACLQTFNEDLIVLGNETNIEIDKAVKTTSLAAYVRLHPFARVMEWMYTESAITALMNTIHQDQYALSRASPESPLIQSILRGIQVLIKVLDLQATFLHLVRPILQTAQKRKHLTVAKTIYTSVEDGILNHLSLVVDLGKYCNLGVGELTLSCLKLLEKVSTSSKLISAWNPETHRPGHRNKAIVQFEKDGEGGVVGTSLAANITAVIDPALEADSEEYLIKLFILDFLYETLRASPDQPTIAHLLLGFNCELRGLSVSPRGAFDSQKSLFHSLLSVVIELVVNQDGRGMRGYLITLKYKILRIFQLLWKSPLSSTLVMDELRSTNFLFHMLLRETQIVPGLPWNDLTIDSNEFLLSSASVAYIDYLASRAIIFEYIGKELCSVSQNRIPSVKRQIFDALNGQITLENHDTLAAHNIFDFFDFMNIDISWEVAPPTFNFYHELDLSPCVFDAGNAGPQYNLARVRECIQLKRSEYRETLAMVPQEGMDEIRLEEQFLLEYLSFNNQRSLVRSVRLELLKKWSDLLLVMFEANEFRGTVKTTFLLQALQAILPTLEALNTDSPPEAFELAKVAKILLYKLDFSDNTGGAPGSETDKIAMGNLVSDKLFQLFQVCMASIVKWNQYAELRGLYYSICYRYLTGVVDNDGSDTRSSSVATARMRTNKAIQLHGERLLHVICDDAYGSDTLCQTSAMVLLSALVHLSRSSPQTTTTQVSIVDSLNRLNFIGVLVDSLKTILQEWLAIISPQSPLPASTAVAAEQYLTAKLCFLLQLSQTRAGAMYILQANLFRAIEVSGVFAADPELEINPSNTVALEKHYFLLASLARIITACVLARGQGNVLQGRNFLQKHRMLVVHTLKRSAGIGIVGNGTGGRDQERSISDDFSFGSTFRAADSILMAKSVRKEGGREREEAQRRLEERIEELAEALMVLIEGTGYLEFELDQLAPERPGVGTTLFH
ncbi:nucleoporin Nup186/Nup192/Nup205 [Triangularia verruculosa]|uniref:Nucleoporin Nup186/Nup192/Nup205 n=1 Tax=Triangularia verruculosa TaxID=2587418 RepID=A0AAN6XS04_9PEZI|nr:nucleoporin Nup186/Nup192/Nup205 [Triangularia verruculosa]